MVADDVTHHDPIELGSDLAAVLGELLSVMDWTQAELARQLSTSQQTVSRWLNGDTTPSPRFTRALQRLVKVHLADGGPEIAEAASRLLAVLDEDDPLREAVAADAPSPSAFRALLEATEVGTDFPTLSALPADSLVIAPTPDAAGPTRLLLSKDRQETLFELVRRPSGRTRVIVPQGHGVTTLATAVFASLAGEMFHTRNIPVLWRIEDGVDLDRGIVAGALLALCDPRWDDRDEEPWRRDVLGYESDPAGEPPTSTTTPSRRGLARRARTVRELVTTGQWDALRDLLGSLALDRASLLKQLLDAGVRIVVVADLSAGPAGRRPGPIERPQQSHQAAMTVAASRFEALAETGQVDVIAFVPSWPSDGDRELNDLPIGGKRLEVAPVTGTELATMVARHYWSGLPPAAARDRLVGLLDERSFVEAVRPDRSLRASLDVLRSQVRRRTRATGPDMTGIQAEVRALTERVERLEAMLAMAEATPRVGDRNGDPGEGLDEQ